MVGLFFYIPCLLEQSPLCQMIVEGGFNSTNLTISH